ncbi:hypothetical protein [Umezawaea beigongshangensis]|uniref:hypothetical protein n=1 Tax=Umezawaea beigongshangensis TaxID=2780383 RepID=UPI0018F21BB9|nr:hypothetical protein [Umezawaea beigongshangensis]
MSRPLRRSAAVRAVLDARAELALVLGGTAPAVGVPRTEAVARHERVIAAWQALAVAYDRAALTYDEHSPARWAMQDATRAIAEVVRGLELEAALLALPLCVEAGER